MKSCFRKLLPGRNHELKLWEVLRPRLPGGTKTPKSRLKLMKKAAFYNSVSLQVYPVKEQGKLSFPVRDAIIESIKE